MQKKMKAFFHYSLGPTSPDQIPSYKFPLLWMMGWGGCSALGFAPLFWIPLTLLSLVALGRFVSVSASPRQAAFWAWGFGFGHFVLGLYWISQCFSVDWNRFWILAPFAFGGLPAFLAGYIGCVGGGTRWLLKDPRPSLPGFVILGGLWVGMEFLRTYLFFGFPWNLLGYVWGASPKMSQLAAWGGVYSLSFLSLLGAAFLDTLCRGEIGPYKKWFWGIGAAFLCIALYGQVRLSTPLWEEKPLLRGRIVQPNISQKDKWLLHKRWENFDQHVSLSLLPSDKQIDVVIWPESVLFARLLKDPLYRKAVRRITPRGGLLLLGAVRLYHEEGTHLANSILMLDHLGRLQGVYDKSHLVPFGEFIPCSRFLPLTKLTEGAKDFTPGSGPLIMDPSTKGFSIPPFSPLVCYEIIFPQGVCPKGEVSSPDWILNVTNDGWFGRTSGPYQHLVAAQFRAIEQGIPVVRAANTGISAVIDSYGRILHKLSLQKEGIIDFDLPPSLKRKTLYYYLGDLPWSLVVFFLFFLALWRLRERKSRHSSSKKQ